jgi:hypothetical protein
VCRVLSVSYRKEDAVERDVPSVPNQSQTSEDQLNFFSGSLPTRSRRNTNWRIPRDRELSSSLVDDLTR